MNRSRKILVPLLSVATLALLLASSCVKRVEKSAKAKEHEAWISSLTDSIRNMEDEIKSTENQLDFLHEKIGTLLNSFQYVNNPREVEGYTILSGWKNRYPLTSTGIVARITENEGYEIVAALSGGNFDAIEVSGNGGAATTAVVSHDQALNYRSGGLTTVAFTAGKGDTIGNFVASAPGTVSLTYLQGGRKVKSISLSEDVKKMLSSTWELYSSQREAETLERQIPLMYKKLQVVRRMSDEGKNKQKPTE